MTRWSPSIFSATTMRSNASANYGSNYALLHECLADLLGVLRVSQVDDVENRVVSRRDVFSEVWVETLEIGE